VREPEFCGRLPEAAFPALIAALDDADTFVRRFAAAALSMIGPPAQIALEKLSELRDTADDELRVWVLEAERNISGP
jgi:HEAT repeat protein